MNYLFEKIYIGTLAENQHDGVLYQGEILCTLSKNKVASDLLNGRFYDFIGHENHRTVANGSTYLLSVCELFPPEFQQNIFGRKTLIRLAEELNQGWTSINIPKEEVKVKRK